MFAYQVCECSRCRRCRSRPTIDRSTDSVVSAALAPARSAGRPVRRTAPRAVVAEAVHVDVDQLAELADQVVDVDPRPAVDVRREFSGQDRGMHDAQSIEPAARALPESRRPIAVCGRIADDDAADTGRRPRAKAGVPR